jgi:hypothetical protein
MPYLSSDSIHNESLTGNEEASNTEEAMDEASVVESVGTALPGLSGDPNTSVIPTLCTPTMHRGSVTVTWECTQILFHVDVFVGLLICLHQNIQHCSDTKHASAACLMNQST